MDLDDLTPAGGGSLRAPVTPAAREPVATFTQTSVMHPDEIWSPHGSEIAPPQRPFSQPVDVYGAAPQEQPKPARYMGGLDGYVAADVVSDTARTMLWPVRN